jgi:hypothetical protein
MSNSLSQPMVAYRGLWDKFAAPCTPEAICRAYSRGVSSLIRCADDSEAQGAIAALSTTEYNRTLQPIVLVVNGAPAAIVPQVAPDVAAAVLAIDGSAPFDRVYPMYRWLDGAWKAVGSYVSLAAWHRGLTPHDFPERTDRENTMVFFESTNVVDDLRLSPLPEGLDDDAICAEVRQLMGERTEISRVSDLVELDWLNQRIREAA